jgi:hypothetical protein
MHKNLRANHAGAMECENKHAEAADITPKFKQVTYHAPLLLGSGMIAYFRAVAIYLV